MCEWLSSREWCDVQLQCGGRSFSAHRAVLASVSSFLRQILLACPHEETPIFIVLPDFDLDAMSSVLYYIYNGEVIVQKQKLNTFLDIIRTMQIFIDEKYLPETYGNIDSNYIAKIDNVNNEIFTLGVCEDSVNIKKGTSVFDLMQMNAEDQKDKNVRHPGLTCVDDLRAECRDRQRDSSLRDLYIETYLQNGNVNGRTAGVLAISNERYRQPASLFSANANGKHLGVDNEAVVSEKSTDLPFWSFGETRRPREYFCSRNLDNHFSDKNFDPTLITKYPNHNISHANMLLPETLLLPKLLPFRLTQNFRDLHLNRIAGESTNVQTNLRVHPSCKTAKGAILNQVLENPWTPRLPINYRPLRKQEEEVKASKNEQETDTLNDSNNNVKSETIDVGERLSPDNDVAIEQSNTLQANCIAGGSDFKCTICNQVFTNNETLQSHINRHTSPARYSCSECSKSFSQLRNFKYHMSIHRGTREFAATCTVCGKYFNDRGYLSSHMKIHRNRKEYKCSQCPKSFNQRVAYNMHVRIHTGVKPHVCSECGKAFSRKMLLKQHQRTHSGERPYACPHCEKRFADRSNMTLHLRLHTGIKPFSCSLCPKSFTKKHHLKSHLNFHTGAKPYSCPRCKLAFTQSSNMRTHFKKCTAPEPDSNETLLGTNVTSS